MLDLESRENSAEFNKGWRISIYGQLAIWAAVAAVGPMSLFIGNNILNAPEPVSRTFTGYYREQAPMGDAYETYNVEYASPNGEALNIASFILGIFAACLLAFLFYCLARFVFDPIMYKIDLHTDVDSPLQLWSKRAIMFIVVALYCTTVFFAGEYDRFPDDEYIWLSDGYGNEFRVNKQEYEKYNSPSKEEKAGIKEETTTKEQETEPSKTPVERGYPSNDLQYYIDHPDEPMPQELIYEVMYE